LKSDFRSAFERFLDGEHNLSHASFVRYCSSIRSFIKFIGPDTKVSDVGLPDFLDWMEYHSLGEAAVAFNFYALRYFLEYTMWFHPFGEWTPAQHSSGEWTTHPMPPDDLLKLLAHNPTDYYALRSRVMVGLSWDRFFAREQHWMILDDINIEMGLARCERGLFGLSGASRVFLYDFLKIRRQYGTTPTLLTGKEGRPIVYDFLLGTFSDYVHGVIGRKYTIKNIAAARFLQDYHNLILKKGKNKALSDMWGRPKGFVRSVLKFFEREGYLDA